MIICGIFFFIFFSSDGIDFTSSITRARFEDLCADYFNATLQPVEQVLRDAQITKENVQQGKTN
jgi:L1 cell adhesion molecule like protein